MKKLLINVRTLPGALGLLLLMGACATAPPAEPGQPSDSAGTETQEATEEPTQPVVTEFGDAWGNAEVRIGSGDPHELGADDIIVGFECVWTDGQKAGVVYPQQFVSQKSGEDVPMEFTWDSGGTIPQGVYDVLVEVDGRAGTGWIRNLPLTGSTQLHVVLDLNACQFSLPLETYEQVIVYPGGTYEDYDSRNMLDAVPEDVELSRFDEYHHGQWAVAPSGNFDLKVTYRDGSVEWMQNYELPENARLTEL